MTVTKSQLNERRRGKGGTLVRHLPTGNIYVVKDLMARKSFNEPDRVGIGPTDRGIAFGVSLGEIELAETN